MSIDLLVEAIHASPIRLSLCICGAGAGVIRRLTRVPECSRTLIEANVLYHRCSTQAALDGLPRHIVSADAARRLAQHAFHKSRDIAFAEAREQLQQLPQLTSTLPRPPQDLLFGVGATSAIKTSRSRHSRDEAYVCIWGGAVNLLEDVSDQSDGSPAMLGEVRHYYMEMPDWLSRAEQDEQVELMVLHAIARIVESCIPADTEMVSKGTHTDGQRSYPRAVFQALLPSAGENTAACGVGVSVSRSSSGLPIVTDSVRLCSMPSESAPESVCLDPSGEVRLALQNVLSAGTSATAPDGSVRDVCALWNIHGELRCSGIPPYPEDARNVAAAVIDHQQESGYDRSAVPAGSRKVIRLLYPGSFNPLHYGHTELVLAATRVLLQQKQQNVEQMALPALIEVTYEIAVKAVDKGVIEVDDLMRRVRQFLHRGERVAVTTATLFVAKARLFPGHGFLIGIDTAVRVLDPKHYSRNEDPAEAEAAMVEALTRDIAGRGCYFVVGGRKMSDATGWQELSLLRIPESVRHLFVGIPATEFRVDVSSTELRAQRNRRGAERRTLGN
ncbi:conserved hypothetical protein [Leishmania braziliensis MHOM/BR/75/M2904]|uniref:Cytidyltransferase-like domain-containing protein n=2 Tax=Leishmania braziliensis TaxID=5660 RepID=E9AIA7_LEIBR|nr:conserved hypothetical protein [Leishmania braziliensis MHOM/BR/75/M2904]CAJ2471919.1 unnamed protein product [Leishmania braziliensis]CBZ14551.1 conserved hypothetical protein [Leishmania braziliensis MHOM/BR/75/M2904]SYZ65497.1 hypothetical_protein [Leishmania braziliensis MHOM/BR/75/M2904]